RRRGSLSKQGPGADGCHHADGEESEHLHEISFLLSSSDDEILLFPDPCFSMASFLNKIKND
ncbi:MAG: hypothetical protein ACRD16_16610, partial [Thermoanaerobaculia bacterium]